VEGAYPSIRLADDSEVFINHKFTDGREKTVLCGVVYQDKETNRTYMQDRGAWIKEQGKGIIVYFMPGHTASDYQKNGISQMILNAIQIADDRSHGNPLPVTSSIPSASHAHRPGIDNPSQALSPWLCRPAPYPGRWQSPPSAGLDRGSRASRRQGRLDVERP
jgi:hypothetical protein